METHALQRPTLSAPVEVKNECDCDVSKSLENGSVGSNCTYMKSNMVKQEMCCDFDDSLENVVLRERRKMLLARLSLQSADPSVEANPRMTSNLSPEDVVQRSVLIGNQDTSSVFGKHLMAEDLHPGKVDYDLYQASNASRSEMASTYSTIIGQPSPASPDGLHGAESIESGTSAVCVYKPYDGQEPLPSNALSAYVNIKVEPLDPDELNRGGKIVKEYFATSGGVAVKNEMGDSGDIAQDDLDHLPLMERIKLIPSGTTSTLTICGIQKHPSLDTLESIEPSSLETEESGTSSFVDNNSGDGWENLISSPLAAWTFSPFSRVKLEPLEDTDFGNVDKTGMRKHSSHHLLSVKNKPEFFQEVSEDALDHMSLIDRIKLLSSETSSAINISEQNRCLKRDIPSTIGLGHNVFQSVEPVSVCCPQKRRKTAISSAQNALEEDAPDLLKVLIEKGISTEEMKLYGASESEEAIDDAFCDDSFAELEAVIWRVFAHHQPLLKLGSLRCSRGSKTSYCVGCLLSLVEQAQFSRSRGWPVEWGWSRDFLAFIFVFEKHNRIVLERPEYGFATYFFELLDSLPIGWQIRRLVIAMKLTNGGRITLLENKPLIVGEDISEGEARVLEQYGWVPNTGLGSMLNYSDRVVHDIKNERNGTEWRLKITKLLIKGYNSGVIVPSFLKLKEEVKEEDSNSMDNPRVKLEL